MSKENITVNKKTFVIAALSLLLVVSIFTGGFGIGNKGSIEANAVAIAEKPSEVPSVNMKSLMDDDAISGDENAKVTIVEFSDYECPFCERFYSGAYPQIKSEYIDTGKVNFVFRDFPLNFHKNAQKAAEAAECAGAQGKYYEMHDQLFENGVSGGTTSFKIYAENIGLNTEDFNECLDSGEMASEVKKDFSDGQKAGVKGTPAFFINGELISGAQPFEVFQEKIEALL